MNVLNFSAIAKNYCAVMDFFYLTVAITKQSAKHQSDHLVLELFLWWQKTTNFNFYNLNDLKFAEEVGSLTQRWHQKVALFMQKDLSFGEQWCCQQFWQFAQYHCEQLQCILHLNKRTCRHLNNMLVYLCNNPAWYDFFIHYAFTNILCHQKTVYATVVINVKKIWMFEYPYKISW